MPEIKPRPTDDAEHRRLITRYLFGEVSPEERAGFEDRYFADDALFEELVAAENDMLDAYAGGKLSAAERKRFETRFLTTPERLERARFAQSLANQVSEARTLQTHHAPSRPARGNGWRLAVAALLLAGVAGGSWMGLVQYRLRGKLRAEQARNRQSEDALRRQVADLNAQKKRQPGNAFAGLGEIVELPAPGQETVLVTLAGGISRGVGPHNLLSLAGISTVLLALQPREAHAGYDVALQTADGAPVYQSKGLVARRSSHGEVVVKLDARILPPGTYVLSLNPGGDVYEFTVSGRP